MYLDNKNDYFEVFLPIFWMVLSQRFLDTFINVWIDDVIGMTDEFWVEKMNLQMGWFKLRLNKKFFRLSVRSYSLLKKIKDFQ